MKNSISLQEFTAGPSGAVQIAAAGAPARDEASALPSSASVRGFHGAPENSAGSFRESLLRRYTAPFVSAIPYHRWGINE